MDKTLIFFKKTRINLLIVNFKFLNSYKKIKVRRKK